jgi:hypothetical protein
VERVAGVGVVQKPKGEEADEEGGEHGEEQPHDKGEEAEEEEGPREEEPEVDQGDAAHVVWVGKFRGASAFG